VEQKVAKPDEDVPGFKFTRKMKIIGGVVILLVIAIIATTVALVLTRSRFEVRV
jgi:hypothetical protein